jgi:hypothetical protein
MQTAESRGYGVYLRVRDWPCSEWLTWQPGHDHLGRVCLQVCADGLGRQSRRVAREQVQRLPLAARLIMSPVPEALDRSPFREDHAMRHEGMRT